MNDEELEFLRWFYFQLEPEHKDVIEWLRKEYETETGKTIPDGY